MTRYAHITGWGMAVPEAMSHQRRPGEDGRDDGRVDHVPHRDPRAAHRRQEREHGHAGRQGRSASAGIRRTPCPRAGSGHRAPRPRPSICFRQRPAWCRTRLGATQRRRLRPVGGLQRVHLCRPDGGAVHPHRRHRFGAGHRRRDAVAPGQLGRSRDLRALRRRRRGLRTAKPARRPAASWPGCCARMAPAAVC